MKHVFFPLAVAMVTLSGLATPAFAQAPDVISHKYFDENGSLVGQDFIACTGVKSHAGNVHTAYLITEEAACGSNPAVEHIVAGTLVSDYTLPGFLSIDTACSIAECASSLLPEPSRLTDKGWTWVSP